MSSQKTASVVNINYHSIIQNHSTVTEFRAIQFNIFDDLKRKRNECRHLIITDIHRCVPPYYDLHLSTYNTNNMYIRNQG